LCRRRLRGCHLKLRRCLLLHLVIRRQLQLLLLLLLLLMSLLLLGLLLGLLLLLLLPLHVHLHRVHPRLHLHDLHHLVARRDHLVARRDHLMRHWGGGADVLHLHGAGRHHLRKR